jgi:uracil-DNA glycosylase family 4
LRKKADDLLREVEERIRFLSEVGAGFAFRNAKEKDGKATVLEPLEDAVRRCTLCPLSLGRRHAVPGEGDYDAELMFVGEAPGADEDLQGRPFVGRAGQLLTRIIAAMKYEREDVYITNIVKCRPPENRTPLRPEIEACQNYLLTQIKEIRPRVIVTLGKVATEFFVPSSAGMTSLRGEFRSFGSIRLMPTFHPAYVLRNEGNPKIKRLVWQDMQKVMAVLGKK